MPKSRELRFYGESDGWEALFYRKEELVIGHRFVTRALGGAVGGGGGGDATLP
jgi:hypothetical protein